MATSPSHPVRIITFKSGLSLEIHQCDITLMETDVIVNAANKYLSHGGGVAAAILARGGEIIQRESDQWIDAHGLINFSHPAYTSGGAMSCKYVIHAVGPVWGESDEDDKLSQAIQGSLKLANQLQVKTISFPAISTGIFGFPVERAAEIFLTNFKKYSDEQQTTTIRKIHMVLFDIRVLDIFIKCFDNHIMANES